MRCLLTAGVLLLSACATPPPVQDDTSAHAVLLGEVHDADSHAALQEQWVARLARRERLGALALEMAERGRTTAGMAPDASEQEVQQALQWNEEAWPWRRYRAAIMAAVRAGVPVLGANLPREHMRAAMTDRALERLLPEPALLAQQQAIRAGHCGLVPEHRIPPMARVQIARDQAMAQTIAGAVRPGKVVVLVAGMGHVHAELGVPRHLPPQVQARPVVLPEPPAAGRADHCEELKKQFPSQVM